MMQLAALVGTIVGGLQDANPRLGNYVYALRDGDRFLYIGCTVNGIWRRIRAHYWTQGPVGTMLHAHWPAAATWRVEVCDFGTELGIAVVERELIRRYRPRINWAHNTGRPRTAIEEAQLRSSIIGPACRYVIENGWPDFGAVTLETLENQPPRAGRRQRKPKRVVPTPEFAMRIAQAGLSNSALLRESDLSQGVIYRMLNPARFGGKGSVHADSAWAMAGVYARHAGVDLETAFTTLFQYAIAKCKNLEHGVACHV
ncbi:MAG TPA: hypothetical protein VGJ87_21920 [Roseiflexaceae bacterium]